MQNTASASRLAEEDGVKLGELGEAEVELLRTCRSDAACTRSDNGLQMAALAVVIQRLARRRLSSEAALAAACVTHHG